MTNGTQSILPGTSFGPSLHDCPRTSPGDVALREQESHRRRSPGSETLCREAAGVVLGAACRLQPLRKVGSRRCHPSVRDDCQNSGTELRSTWAGHAAWLPGGPGHQAEGGRQEGWAGADLVSSAPCPCCSAARGPFLTRPRPEAGSRAQPRAPGRLSRRRLPSCVPGDGAVRGIPHFLSRHLRGLAAQLLERVPDCGRPRQKPLPGASLFQGPGSVGKNPCSSPGTFRT